MKATLRLTIPQTGSFIRISLTNVVTDEFIIPCLFGGLPNSAKSTVTVSSSSRLQRKRNKSALIQSTRSNILSSFKFGNDFICDSLTKFELIDGLQKPIILINLPESWNVVVVVLTHS